MDEFKDNLNKERKVEHHDIAQQMLQNVRGNFALDEATGSMDLFDNNEPRRRSTRDIKKPKFDDELVESVIQSKQTPKRRHSNEKHSVAINNGVMLNSNTANPIKIPFTSASNTSTVGSVLTSAFNEFDKTQQSNNKNRRKTPEANTSIMRSLQPNALLNQWAPEDDIALIAAVTHIEERWYELLYDEEASLIAKKRMEQIDRQKILSIQEKIPFSLSEEQLLRQIPSSTQQPISPILAKILEQNKDSIFHYARTVKILEEHWRELRLYGLLNDQRSPQHLNHSQDEDNFTFDLYSLASSTDANNGQQLPMDVEERQFTRNVSICEREVKEWEGAAVLVSNIVGIIPSEPAMSPETVGLFCGRCTTFDVRKERVLIGRSTKRHNVEVNLTLEGPTAYISRKQAIFKLTENNNCLLRNIGKRHININGKAILQGEAIELLNNSIIIIGLIHLKFIKNLNYKGRNGINNNSAIINALNEGGEKK